MFSLFPCPGQFWNIPVQIAQYRGDFNFNAISRSKYYNITVSHPDSDPRSFVGLLYDLSWELENKRCFYVGNRQGGPSGEPKLPEDSVIEGSYQDYITDGPFETSFEYSVFTHAAEC